MPRTMRWCRCRFLSQLSQCINVPKTLSTRGAHSTMCKQLRVLSRTTHTNGDPLSSHDFSNLTNSPSPTPELQYTRDGISEYIHSKCTCALEVYTLKQIRVWIKKYAIQGKASKKTRHAYVLVWKNKDENLITWSCSCDHQQGPVCVWDTRVWAIGTHWWVHRVVDPGPARREASLSYIEESSHRRLLLQNCVGFFFWREVFVLPILIILY